MIVKLIKNFLFDGNSREEKKVEMKNVGESTFFESENERKKVKTNFHRKEEN